MQEHYEHFFDARKITLVLYVISGIIALFCCFLAEHVSIVSTLIIGMFWLITLVILLVAKKNQIYGFTMLISAACLGCVMYWANGSPYAMLSVLLIQWLGGIFFMWKETVTITIIIQIIALTSMLFLPFGKVLPADTIKDFIVCYISVFISSYCCGKLVDLLNSEVEKNLQNAEARSKLLDELQKQYAEIERALNAKSEFLASMSHEIRTPINTIIGMNEVALRECRQDDLVEPLRNITLASDNLLSIINDVLDFSKIEAGHMEMMNKPYELREVVNNVVRMHSLKAHDKGLQFNVSLAPDTPAYFEGDEVRIFQVFSNLVSNAIKYTDSGLVEINIHAKRTGASRATVYFAVRDTGIGIKSEDRVKLFQTFQRLDMNRNCKVEGTGLGLALVDKVIKAMNGEVYVDSEFGVGSTFTVCFPQKILSDETIGAYSAEEFKSAIKKATYKNSFTAPDAHILFVDDNQMNLSVASSLLKYTKVQVTTCMSGNDCLKLTSKKHFDIIFLDHMMPEMDGIETLKRLKTMEDNLCRNTPVIALTANAIAGSRDKYLKAGFDNYLSKPIMYKDFEKMILHYLPEEVVTLTEHSDDNPVEELKPEFESKSETGDAGLIDEKTGLEYSGNDDTLYRQLLEIFAGEASKISDELNNAFSNGDWITYQRGAHTIKSNSKGIGALTLSEAAKTLEQLAKDSDADSVAAQHSDFIALISRVIEEISIILDK